MSLDSGVGLLKVCSKFPVVASNRYAEPALLALVLSVYAPTSVLLPSIDTEMPKKSPVSGVGLFKVCKRVPLATTFVVPFDGSVTDSIVSSSPSASVSFARTSITTGVSNGVVAESLTATGGLFGIALHYHPMVTLSIPMMVLPAQLIHSHI